MKKKSTIAQYNYTKFNLSQYLRHKKKKRIRSKYSSSCKSSEIILLLFKR